jgi:hypothetical protein
MLARVEAVMGRSFRSRTDGPLAIEIEGDPGGVSSVAALELSLEASVDVSSPIVEVQLPAGVEADEALLEVVRSSPDVRDAAARHPAFLRVWLEPMEEGTHRVVPLPIRWTARGSLLGLGAVAFPEDRPGAMMVLPPRTLEVR